MLVALVVVIFVWAKFFNDAPTCFDGTRNGSEVGVDCGGSCSLVCVAQVKDPTVLWARSFVGPKNIYTAAAYVQNNNQGESAHNVQYSFLLYDDNNKLVIEKDGVFDIPPVQTVPVVVTSIDVGYAKVARTLFTFTNTPVWHAVAKDTVSSIRVTRQVLSSDATRLDATLTNDTVQDAQNVTVTAILFDRSGVARAASSSVVPLVAHRGSSHVVFTWGVPTSDIQTAEISILPTF